MLTSSSSRNPQYPPQWCYHLMSEVPVELKSWNQFPAFAEVPICQCCVHLSHSQVPYEVSNRKELSWTCPIDWNMSMYYIVVVIYQVAVAEVKFKWLPIIELPAEELPIPSLVFPPRIHSVQLFKCHSGGHNIHDILWLLEKKYIECLTLSTIFSYGIQHIDISNIFVSEVLVKIISRYTHGPLFALLDDCSSIGTKIQLAHSES